MDSSDSSEDLPLSLIASAAKRGASKQKVGVNYSNIRIALLQIVHNTPRKFRIAIAMTMYRWLLSPRRPINIRRRVNNSHKFCV